MLTLSNCDVNLLGSTSSGASCDGSWESQSMPFHFAESDDNSDNDDETLQALSALLPARNRYVRASRRKPLPRIIKQDIRRHYPQMLFNALNSHDSAMIDAFMQRYANPAATMEKTLDGPSVSTCTSLAIDSATVRVVVKGSSAISKYWTAMNSILPDHCLWLRGVNIVRRACTVTDPVSGKKQLVGDPNGTEIVCDIEGHSTNMFDVSPPTYAYAALGHNFAFVGDSLEIYDDPATCGEMASTHSPADSPTDDDGDVEGPAKRPRRLSSSLTVGPRPFPTVLPLVRRRRLLDTKLSGQLVIGLDRLNRLASFHYRSMTIMSKEL